MNFYNLPLLDQIKWLAQEAKLAIVNEKSCTSIYNNTYNVVKILLKYNTPRLVSQTGFFNKETHLVFDVHSKEAPSSARVYITGDNTINCDSVVRKLSIGNNLIVAGNSKEVLLNLETIYGTLGSYDDTLSIAAAKVKELTAQLVKAEALTAEGLDAIDVNCEGARTATYFIGELVASRFEFKHTDVKEQESLYVTKDIFDGTGNVPFFTSIKDKHIAISIQYNEINPKVIDIVLYLESDNGDKSFNVVGKYDLSKKDSDYRTFSKNFVPYLEETLLVGCNDRIPEEHHQIYNDLVQYTILKVVNTLKALPEKAPIYSQLDDCD